MKNQLSIVVWETLFNEEFKGIPDPNKPENIPRIEAEHKKEVKAFTTFAEGVGKPLFKQLQNDLRFDILILLTKEHLPGDEALEIVNRSRYLANLIAKAQSIIDEAD